MVHANATARVETVLAEYANTARINGLAAWDPSDFRSAAEKFVAALAGAVVMSDQLHLRSADDYVNDLADNLRWDIPDGHGMGALRAALAEVGPDFTDLEF